MIKTAATLPPVPSIQTRYSALPPIGGGGAVGPRHRNGSSGKENRIRQQQPQQRVAPPHADGSIGPVVNAPSKAESASASPPQKLMVVPPNKSRPPRQRAIVGRAQNMGNASPRRPRGPRPVADSGHNDILLQPHGYSERKKQQRHELAPLLPTAGSKPARHINLPGFGSSDAAKRKPSAPASHSPRSRSPRSPYLPAKVKTTVKKKRMKLETDDDLEKIKAMSEAELNKLVFSSAKHNHLDTLKSLFHNHLIEATITDKFGNNVMTVAGQTGNKKLARLALKYGVDINHQNVSTVCNVLCMCVCVYRFCVQPWFALLWGTGFIQ